MRPEINKLFIGEVAFGVVDGFAHQLHVTGYVTNSGINSVNRDSKKTVETVGHFLAGQCTPTLLLIPQIHEMFDGQIVLLFVFSFCYVAFTATS